MYPDAQAQAAQELERVVGQDRIPSIADLSQLPYISAVWKEALRWSPPAPIGQRGLTASSILLTVQQVLPIC
jgi:cytochrome P450